MNSKAIQILYDEHDIILRAIEIIESLLQRKDQYSQSETLLWFITFFREYGDLYHHHKEEDIFFSVLEKKNQILAESIIQALKEHHEMFREDLSRAQNAISEKNWEKVKEIFRQYLFNLRNHISAENNELFITAEQILSDDEKETLYFSFLDKDRELGENRKGI